MEIFEKFQKYLATLGITPSNESTQKHPINEKVFVGILLFGCIIGSQLVYTVHVANDFIDHVIGIFITSGTIITSICFVNIALKRKLIFKSIENIEKLSEARCNRPKSRRLLLKTNRKVERLTDTVFMLEMKVALQSIMLPKCFASFAAYFLTDLGHDSFQMPLPMWFPFDVENPIGYLVAFILEYIILAYQNFISACALALTLGGFWFSISIIKEIQRILRSINVEARANEHQSNELKVLLIEYIDTHSAMKEVSNDFSDIYQPINMSFFTWSIIAISGAMIQLQVEMRHGNFMPLLQLIFFGILVLTILCFSCEINQRLTDAYDEINKTIDQFRWYLFPKEAKRMLPMIIANAQQPVEMECFGSISCTRELFKNIIHRAYSYFMVLRQVVD